MANADLNALVTGATVKAIGFNSSVKGLREMLPPTTFERMVQSLTAETAEVVLKPPLPVAWVPARCVYELYEVALRVAFDGDEEQLMDLGRRSILNDLKGVYRMFIRLASAKYVIDRGARLWDTYWRGNGRVSIDEVDGNVVEIHYHDLFAANRAFWLGQRGAILGIIEATGLKAVDVAVVRGGGNERHCTLRVSWQ